MKRWWFRFAVALVVSLCCCRFASTLVRPNQIKPNQINFHNFAERRFSINNSIHCITMASNPSNTRVDGLLANMEQQLLAHQEHAAYFQTEAGNVAETYSSAAIETLQIAGLMGDPRMVAFAKQQASREAVPIISHLFGLVGFANENALEVTSQISKIHQQKEAHRATMVKLKSSRNVRN
jgi:hypothetical protein